MIFVFVWLTLLSMIISRSIHVPANGIISFFLCSMLIKLHIFCFVLFVYTFYIS